MSHTNIDRYSDPSHLIIYLNGFLRSLEILNDETDYASTFYVEELFLDQSIEHTIVKHLAEYHGVEILNKVTITYTELNDWKTEIESAVIEYFEHVLTFVELTPRKKDYIRNLPNHTIRDVSNFTYINKQFIKLISKLVDDNTKVYEVFAGGIFLECSQKDYLIVRGDKLYFIHLAWSD